MIIRPLTLGLLALSSFAAQAAPDITQGMTLTVVTNGPCTSWQAGYFVKGHHAKGDRGVLNEHNYGPINQCFLNDRADGGYVAFRTYVMATELVNSRYARTFAGGPGFELITPTWSGVRLGIGGELPFVYYPVPTRGQIYGFLPIQTRNLTYTASDRTSVGVMTRKFGNAKETVTLTNLFWQYRF